MPVLQSVMVSPVPFLYPVRAKARYAEMGIHCDSCQGSREEQGFLRGPLS